MSTIEIDHRYPGFCSCGLEMAEVRAGSGVLMCGNCDTVQPQETVCPDCGEPGKCEKNPGKRIPTGRDYAFVKVWRQRILRIYPGS